MFYKIKGQLIHTEPGMIAIDVNGVAFQISTSMNTMRTMPKLGENAEVYTYLVVREDALTLYGFATERELNCYKMLTSITGVGPKVGIAILSELTPDDVAMAAASGDAKRFTQANGVGPKLGQRIVLELKDKVKNFAYSDDNGEVQTGGIVSASSNAANAVIALTALGYSQSEAAMAVARLEADLTTEELIQGALKFFAQ